MAESSSKKQKSYDATTIKSAIKETGQVETLPRYAIFRPAIRKHSPKIAKIELNSAPEKFITEAIFELYLDRIHETHFIRNDDAFFLASVNFLNLHQVNS